MSQFKPFLDAMEINLNNNVLPDKATVQYILSNRYLLSSDEQNRFQNIFDNVNELLKTKHKTVDKALKTINKSIKKNKPVNQDLVNMIIDVAGTNYLTKSQNAKFTELLPEINQTSNLPIKTKENIFMKIPFVNKIVNQIKTKRFNSQYKDIPVQKATPNISQNIDKATSTKIQDTKKSFVPKSDIYKPQTIVISDLHGDMNRWNTIREHLQKYPNTKFIIEGDAMDRGAYGIDILLEIKELSDSGKVQYLPGNHDIFTYNYLKSANTPYKKIQLNALMHLEHNGGKTTIDALENFDVVVDSAIKSGRLHNRISKQELTDWLGKQPIQTLASENNINYALAHAVFDSKLYNEDKNFNMEKAYNIQTKPQPTPEEQDKLNRFNNCMWYREHDKNTHFAPLSWPKDFLVVVGHTKQKEANIQNIDGDPRKSIVYIDCKKGNFQGFNLTESKHISLEQQKTQEQENSLEK